MNIHDSHMFKHEQTKLEKRHVYLAIHKPGKSWDEIEQTYLGVISWDTAVSIAISQDKPVRLSTSKGYNNQGYYFHPETK